MDFKVGDRVRIKAENGAGPGGYAYTRIGSEGVIQNVDTLTRIATIKFYKLTGGFQPIPYDNRIYGIVVADIELLQPRSNYRRIEL